MRKIILMVVMVVGVGLGWGESSTRVVKDETKNVKSKETILSSTMSVQTIPETEVNKYTMDEIVTELNRWKEMNKDVDKLEENIGKKWKEQMQGVSGLSKETYSNKALEFEKDNRQEFQKIRKVKEEKDKLLKILAEKKPETEKEVKLVTNMLTMNDVDMTKTAYKVLEKITPEDKQLEPIFVKMLRDTKFSAQFIGIKMCGVIRSKKALPILLKQFKEIDSHKQPRDYYEGTMPLTLIETLGYYGKEILPKLIEIAKTSNEETKQNIGSVIKRIRDKEAIPQLFEIAKDDNQHIQIREDAVISIGYIIGKTNDEDSLNNLIKLYEFYERDKKLGEIGRDRGSLKWTIISAIGYSGSKKAIPFLKRLMQLPREQDSAIIQLGCIKDEESINILLEVIKTDDNTENRNSAISSLGDIGREFAREKIIRILQDLRKTEKDKGVQQEIDLALEGLSLRRKDYIPQKK
ncbi:MAG: HEAT repeat domain-containing protein [Elusimicrobiota bacterium]